MSEDLHVYDVASTAGAPAARRLETLWMSAIGTAYVPYIIVLVNLAAFGSFVRVELPIALFSAAVALGLMIAVYPVARPRGVEAQLGIITSVFLGLNLVATVLASYSFFANPSCSQGRSGPCMDPFMFLGGGLVACLFASIPTAFGISRGFGAPLRRQAKPPRRSDARFD